MHHIVHHFSSTIHHYNTIIQIVIFLGVFITRVIGVSRNDGDFFMGVLNILVFQALQPFSGQPLDSRHEHTITQLPGSIWAALSKFDIDTKTIVYAVCPKCHCTYPPQTSLGESTTPSTHHTAPTVPLPVRMNVVSLCSDVTKATRSLRSSVRLKPLKRGFTRP